MSYMPELPVRILLFEGNIRQAAARLIKAGRSAISPEGARAPETGK